MTRARALDLFVKGAIVIGLGVLTSIAFAWVPETLRSPIGGSYSWISLGGERPRAVRVEHGFGWRRLYIDAALDNLPDYLRSVNIYRGDNIIRTSSAWWDDKLPAPYEVTPSLIAQGWPRTCLYARDFWIVGPVSAARGVSGGVVMSDYRTFALRPVWPGLFLNTALFTIVWTAIALAVSTARRRYRLHRGRCLACGHHLAGLATCPECGTGEPPRSLAS